MALCVVCVKEVRPRQHAIQCDRCDQWQHRICETGMDLWTYRQLAKGLIDLDFICKKCQTPPSPPTSPAPPSPPTSPAPLSPPTSPAPPSPPTSPSLIGSPVVDEKMVTDFEAATWKGFQEVFRAVQVKGCTFHLNQAIFRKVQNLSLAQAYEQDVGTNRFIKKLMALQFLDSANIKRAFDQLKSQASTPALVALCNYFESTWINSSVWTVSNWCVFGTSIRTNNDLESWHRRLNQLSGRRAVPFYRLIPLLFKEADLIPLQVRLITDGQLDRRQGAAQMRKSEAVFKLWDRFTGHELTVSQLLREIAKINGPM